MVNMSMGSQQFRLTEIQPGVYRYFGPALVMPGRWQLSFEIRPPRGDVSRLRLIDVVAR
jgi:hypothetical protein